ncbi:MAG: hypothetical protein II942_03390 [Alphaproteobacteria bacterium]|nr:hypothetical protein [Alphaproteobacteria bacterium]
MGFNLVTFLAQLVNLAILIWVLKHFLYGPVMAVIDKRRDKIAHDIEQAKEALASAEQTQKTLDNKIAEFEHEKQQRFNAMDTQVEAIKMEEMNKLAQHFHEKQQKMQDDLNRSWNNAQQNIHDMIASEFLRLTKNVLSEWSDDTPMDQVLSLFKKKLDKMTKKQRSDLDKALLNQKLVTISTSETLTKKQQQFVTDLLRKNCRLSDKTKLRFTQDASLILGLEMRVGQFLVDWNIKTYLDELQQNLTHEVSGLIAPHKGKAKE